MTLATTGNTEAQLNSARWAQIARAPRGPVSAVQGHIAGALLRRAARRLPIRLKHPDGSVLGAADPTLPTMTLHRPEALFRRVGRYGLIGFGDPTWPATGPPTTCRHCTEFAASVDVLIPPALQRLRPLAVVRHPRSMHNSPAQSRRNIADHSLSRLLGGGFPVRVPGRVPVDVRPDRRPSMSIAKYRCCRP